MQLNTETSFIRFLGHIKYSSDIEEALAIATRDYDLESSLISELSITVNTVVHHPALKSFFDQELTVYTEREILTDHHQIVIPDRIVINNQNMATILDYKTGASSKAHHKQLVTYEKAVQVLGFSVQKKLLVYINDGVEVVEVD